MTKNSERPSSPSTASMTDDDDAVFIRTPPSEADYDVVEFVEEKPIAEEKEKLISIEEQTAATAEPPLETQEKSEQNELEQRLWEHYGAATPTEQDVESEKARKTEPTDGSADQQPPGAFPSQDQTTDDTDPPEEFPDVTNSQPQQNPFIAAAGAAIGLSTLIAMFTARTIYNGATAAGHSAYTNFQNDLRDVDNDFNAAFDDLSFSFAAVTRELSTARQVLRQEAGSRRQEAETLMREARASVSRDMDAVWRDLSQSRAEVERAAREARGSVRAELVNTWQEIANAFRGL